MHRIQRINNRPGTYVLLAKSGEPGQIQIGQRGVLQLEVGWYVYVGSAFGPGGLAARIGRHCGTEVIHLLADSTEQAHQLSPVARRESAALIYDRV